MMLPDDKKFTDELHAKLFKGHKADRAANTDKIVSKLDELKPLDKIEITNFPEQQKIPDFPITDLTETNTLLKQLVEKKDDIHITLKIT